jgi:hypothetical protein
VARDVPTKIKYWFCTSHDGVHFSVWYSGRMIKLANSQDEIVVNKLPDLLFVIPDLMDDVELGYFDQSIDEVTYHLSFK